MAFTLRSTDEAFAEAMRWHLAPFRAPAAHSYSFPVDMFVPEDECESDSPTYTFRLSGRDRFHSRSLVDVLTHAVWDVHASVPQKVRDFLFVHAGCVARDGGALLLPAWTESGKSTLTLALAESGFDYLSDDLAPIDPVTGRVYPFPKRIKLLPDAVRHFPGLEERLGDRSGLTGHLRERFVRPEDVSSRVGGPSQVRWIVFPTPNWDGPARLEELGRSRALEPLTAACFNGERYGKRAVVLLARVLEGARVYRLLGGSPRDRAHLLGELTA